MNKDGELIQILLVEDNPADIRITQEVLKDAKVANDLHIARDGEEGLAFLRREGDFAGSPEIDLVLLDLNMPRMGGLEVLEEMRKDERLRHTPVVVLTTSEAEADVLRAYDNGSNAYVTKPVDLDQFVKVVRGIEEFWLGIVRLPQRTVLA